MPDRTSFDLPNPTVALLQYLQNITTMLESLMPLLDLLEASSDPATEEARKDLSEILGQILKTNRSMAAQQIEMMGRLDAIEQRLSSLEVPIKNLALLAGRLNQRLG